MSGCFRFLFVVTMVCASRFVVAGTVWLYWGTDKEPVSYGTNEPMRFRVQLVEDGAPLAGKTLRWRRFGDDRQEAAGEVVTSADGRGEIVSSIAIPGFVRIEVKPCHADGVTLKGASGSALVFNGSAAAGRAGLAPFAEPPDFDAFWKGQRARLDGVPLQATLRKLEARQAGFDVFDVRVDCAGGRPVSGYLAIPQGSGKGSLPAYVGFVGYGARSATLECRKDMIVFQTNAHGIENGREPEYYQALMKGELKGYGFDAQQNARPETTYFNGMILRVMRALDFVKSRPEWDGKAITVYGSSQGGFQALAAAALDHAVTVCQVKKPWFCDLGGIRLGRMGGWRPDYTDGLAYYDGVNMAKRIACETHIISGLGDTTCPPSGLTVLYNIIKAPKSIEYLQGIAHGYETPPNPPEPERQVLSDK